MTYHLPITRRSCLALLFSAGLAPLPLVTDALAGGTPRVIEVEPEDDRNQPPVITAVAMQPGGRLLAAAGDDHLVRIWDDNMRLLRVLRGHGDWVRTIDFAPDGAVLATAGGDGRILCWDPETGRKLRTLAEHGRPVARILFSHDGRLLAAVGYGDKLRIYRTAEGAERFALDCPCRDMRAIAFSPDDQILAAGGRNGRIAWCRMDDGRRTAVHQAHRQRIRALAFSPDGQRLVSTGEDRVIRVWNAQQQQLGEDLPAGRAKIMSLVFCGPEIVAVGGSDNVVRLWNLKSGSMAGHLVGHTGSVATLSFRDGVLASGSFDTTIRIWPLSETVADASAGPAARLGAAAEGAPTR